jgi:cysteine-rich repeat protein
MCGNSIVEPPETCDDGNLIGGDGCSMMCQIEP